MSVIYRRIKLGWSCCFSKENITYTDGGMEKTDQGFAREFMFDLQKLFLMRNTDYPSVQGQAIKKALYILYNLKRKKILMGA